MVPQLYKRFLQILEVVWVVWKSAGARSGVTQNYRNEVQRKKLNVSNVNIRVFERHGGNDFIGRDFWHENWIDEAKIMQPKYVIVACCCNVSILPYMLFTKLGM